jgi:3-oxoacyl-[acyl-carrier protein] reductase
MFDFSGQLALVCGSSQGMGRASAQLLAANGAQVICVSRSETNLLETINSLNNPSLHRYFSCDFSDRNSINKLIESLAKEKLEPDILINNSSGPKSSTALELTEDELNEPYKQHLIASNLISQALIQNMIKKNYGRIINIISISGKMPSDNIASSNIVRAAMIAWSKTLSNEIAVHCITINNILPGYTLTERLKEVIEARAKKQDLETRSIEESIINKIPMKRFAKPEEIAAAVCFLASREASYITGSSLAVDGGYLPCI